MATAKTNLTKMFAMRVPVELLERLETIARQRDMSMTAVFLTPWIQEPPRIGRPPKRASGG